MDSKTTGGWTMNRERFSDSALNVFELVVSHRRLFVVLPDDAMRGVRFNSDQDVLARVESMCTEAGFLDCPGRRVDKALVDAAQADWWYTYEKQYDDPYIPDTESEDENDD
jgi:hypothetical protein